jgi:hypothetical protein
MREGRPKLIKLEPKKGNHNTQDIQEIISDYFVNIYSNHLESLGEKELFSRHIPPSKIEP